jgi:hypothetical protein
VITLSAEDHSPYRRVPFLRDTVQPWNAQPPDHNRVTVNPKNPTMSVTVTHGANSCDNPTFEVPPPTSTPELMRREDYVRSLGGACYTTQYESCIGSPGHISSIVVRVPVTGGSRVVGPVLVAVSVFIDRSLLIATNIICSVNFLSSLLQRSLLISGHSILP